jgi:chemosensory pili system protein ChpA (sensor histidine kinase/response regulator)
MHEDIDEDLVQVFIEEATDLLEALYRVLRVWHEDLLNFSLCRESQRDLHTLKGGARMINQPHISAVAHELETVYESILSTKSAPTESLYELIRAGHDHLSSMIDGLKSQQPVILPLTWVSVIHEHMNAQAESDPLKTFEKKSEVIIKKNDDVIRVKTDLVERLNLLAEENNIVRVLLSQQVVQLKSDLLTLDETTKTLFGYMRQCELEANLNSLEGDRMEDLSPGVSFDSLELDRYSKFHSTWNGVREMMHHWGGLFRAVHERQLNIDELVPQLSRVSCEFKAHLNEMCLMPFDTIEQRLERVVRQVSNDLNKQVDFVIVKSEEGIERNLLEKLVPILEHLIRNAIDHGIESSESRIKLNKAERGNVKLSFSRLGSEISVELSDDGRGINLQDVAQKAKEMGLITEGDSLDSQKLLNMILLPGFSTKETLSEISGRGIGMDVVNKGIAELSGRLLMYTELNQGTRIVIQLPILSSLSKVLFFSIQKRIYALPLSDIKDVLIRGCEKGRSSQYLGDLLGFSRSEAELFPKRESVICLRSGSTPMDISVDSFIGTREIVVRPLGPQFKGMPEYSGGTISADGGIVIVLSANGLVTLMNQPLGSQSATIAIHAHDRCIMVVDDSVTVRTVTRGLLERNKFKVILAKDGIDALEQLEHRIPDLILLDIEMPRMDGFEFLKSIRQNVAYKNVPVIVITSRAGDKHQSLAFQLGADLFLGKPYVDVELLSLIASLFMKRNNDASS